MILPYRVRLKTFEWDQMQADESGIADIFITRSTTILQLGQLFLINLNKQWGFDKQIITMKLNNSFGLEGVIKKPSKEAALPLSFRGIVFNK